ncbi:MAG: hypothetical protein ACYC5G_05995, partial [Candidatus Doudnabacteria bacterium]
MNLKKLFLMLTFFVLMGTTAFAQTQYYVDVVAGNDSWTGTAATFQSGNVGPKKTIQAMHDYSGIVSGDVINIAAGTYPESVTLTKLVQLKNTGAVSVTNLTLNTNTTGTTVTVGNAGQNLTITGTLLVQSGKYGLTTANVILGVGGTLEVRVAGSAGIQSPISPAGAYTLTFSNTSALTYTPAALYNANPVNVNFNGSATVTLGAAATCTGDISIASGASVALANTFSLTGGANFTNNGSYSATNATDAVVVSTAGGTVSGSGTFQNLTINHAGTTMLGSNINFTNISQAVASVFQVVATATLDFQNFTLTTPGSVSLLGATAYSGAGTTTPGVLAFTGDAGTIGTVNFTVTNASVNTLANLTVNKPSGSTVNFTDGGGGASSLTITNQFLFSSGILNINDNNLVLGNTHIATASIGGNINGTG